MPKMSEKYKTDKPLSFKGRGTPPKKKKKAKKLPEGKMEHLPATPGMVDPDFGLPKTKRRVLTLKPVNDVAKKKRKGLGPVTARRW